MVFFVKEKLPGQEPSLETLQDTFSPCTSTENQLQQVTEGDGHQHEQEPAYNPKIASLLAYVAAWSYSDLSTFQAKLAQRQEFCGADFCEIAVVNKAMFVVAYAQLIRIPTNKTVIISFRGTEIDNIVSWLTDAGTRKVPLFPTAMVTDGNDDANDDDDDDIQVHSGFLRNFQEVWQGTKGVRAHLLDPQKMDPQFHSYPENSTCSISDNSDSTTTIDQIYITGHSLGGAMAVLCALTLQHDHNNNNNQNQPTASLWSKVKGIYTFGQPMVVDVDSRQACQKRIGHILYRHVYYIRISLLLQHIVQLCRV